MLCPAGGNVVDPFCGSGTTLVAAKRLGRKWLGIEIDSGVAASARKRIEGEADA
ncbi:MAG: site-specific DNA-methyltransferase [Planctomycetales bacterium]|nr:site-specific DNA-methyltransferase [Planctomycetales bacterium]